MKFRNPWIDPRITQVRPQEVESYLLSHGWRLVGPAANPALRLFEGRSQGEELPTILLPLRVTDGSSLQWMIDVVADLARYEDRWAVDVLSDILQQRPSLVPVSGPASLTQTEPIGR